MNDNSRSSKTRSGNLRSWRWTLPRIAGLLVALSGFIALADQLCFNHVTAPGAPPNFGAPPLIDGSVANGDTRCFNPGATPPCNGPDLGWTNSFSYIFNNPDGPVNPDVTVEGIRDDTHLYLSVQVNNSTPTSGTSDPNNTVVVAFDPDNTGKKMQFLVIAPVPIGAPLGNKQNAQFVDFYWNQNSVSSPSTAASNYVRNPSWLSGAAGNSNVPCGTPGTTCIQSDIEGAQWTMELALPLVGPSGNPSLGLILPPTGHFGMYIDVLRIVDGMWSQAPWPSNAAMPGCTTPLVSCQLTTPPVTSIPATSSWGTGTIDPNPSPACTGIYVGSQNLDVYVTNSAYGSGNAIDGSNPNTFHANVHNTAATTVPNLVINFFIANFGLPSEWQQIATSQPPSGSSIPPGTTTVNSNAWTPPTPSVYLPPNQHQCILATLSANPPNSTYFVNNSAVQNMNVFDASRVERPVQVSSKGYPVNPQHNTEQEFDINVTTRLSTINPCAANANNPNRTPDASVNCNPAAQMIETAEACRHTGMFLLNSSKQPIELCQAVGSFSFVAKHVGTVKQWTYQLAGPGLTGSATDGKYHLRMPNNSVVNLNNVVEANTGGCTHLFGAAVPGLLIAGVFAIGLATYRPRKQKRQV